MTHGNSTYFRSKTLNDEWEDLSQSVSCVLQVHEGPEFNKAERSSRTITATHWVKAIERTHCSERSCGKKFSLRVRKHHCRRCGEVFCNQCSQFKRRLSLLAIPDPNGVSYRVCKRCFDVGPQILGTIRPHMEEFNVWREMTSKDRDNNKNTITDPETDIYEELQRLVNGYRNHLSKSKIKSFVAEALSLVKIPEWQKSKCWM
ncbi:RUN and FYVE domain-containing protein 2, partial [Acropora cervicornis]